MEDVAARSLDQASGRGLERLEADGALLLATRAATRRARLCAAAPAGEAEGGLLRRSKEAAMEGGAIAVKKGLDGLERPLGWETPLKPVELLSDCSSVRPSASAAASASSGDIGSLGASVAAGVAIPSSATWRALTRAASAAVAKQPRPAFTPLARAWNSLERPLIFLLATPMKPVELLSTALSSDQPPQPPLPPPGRTSRVHPQRGPPPPLPRGGR